MSAFLGPIHIKMYDRILYQDEMSQALLLAAEKKGWADDIRKTADAKAPAALRQPLEVLIDQGNIHGWLGKAVSNSESRFALISGGILAGHPERLDPLQGVMKKLGQQFGFPAGVDAEQAFRLIHDILLDGMPCDFPFNVTESNADTVVWQVESCPHAPYWEPETGGAEVYYQLRDAWVEGTLQGSGISHTRTGGGNILRKEP